MKRIVFLLFLFAIISPMSVTGEYYKYIDENGNVLFTDDIGKIPEAQRSKIENNNGQSITSNESDYPSESKGLFDIGQNNSDKKGNAVKKLSEDEEKGKLIIETYKIKKVMTSSEFNSCGLNKLSEEELAEIDTWFLWHTLAVSEAIQQGSFSKEVIKYIKIEKPSHPSFEVDLKGLNKLSKEELGNLNNWVQSYTLKIYETFQQYRPEYFSE